MTTETSYNGNIYVKRDGVVQNYTAHELEEYIRCRDDVAYFCENYVKVISLDKGLVPFKLRGYQTKMVKHFDDNKFNIVLACRQSGKSITSVAWLLHYVIFNSEKKIGMLANKGATAREMLARLTLMLENLPFFLQPGCKVLNKGSIKFSNNSEIIAAATSSSSIRGLSLNCVSGDTKVCVLDDDGGIWYDKITECINNDMPREFIEKKHYIVYKTTNVLNGKIYVGFHSTNNLEDGYLGSGELLQKAIEKYGPQNFERKILFIFDNQTDAQNKEREIVNESFVNDENTYNLVTGGNICILKGKSNPFYGKSHTKESRDKISEKAKGRPNPKNRLHIFDNDTNLGCFTNFLLNIPDQYKHLSAKTTNETLRNVLVCCGDPKTSLHFKETHKQKTCETLYQKESVRDKDTEYKLMIQRMSESRRGKKKPDWFGKKISEKLTGQKKSKEHVDKINRNPEKIRKTAEKHRGMKRSEETKLKMSAAAKQRGCFNKGKKFYSDPNNIEDRGYYIPGCEPLGWINKTKV